MARDDTWHSRSCLSLPQEPTVSIGLYRLSEEKPQDSRKWSHFFWFRFPRENVTVMNLGCPTPQRALSFASSPLESIKRLKRKVPMEFDDFANKRTISWLITNNRKYRKSIGNERKLSLFSDMFHDFTCFSSRFPTTQRRYSSTSLPLPWLSERIFPRTRP